MRAASFSFVLFCLEASSTPGVRDQSPLKETSPREIHTPAYDLLLPAEQKALPLLRRSGFAKAQ
jgi:hypothetical protein